MKIQKNKLDFTDESFFIGIDVHKKSWTITIRNNNLHLRTYSMQPSTHDLAKFLRRNYPNGEYYSIYEAGFSGYWLDRELKKEGIRNIIVNPADIPTMNKEKTNRNDNVDSRKLARELEKGELTAIYIPTDLQEEIRSMCRVRYQLVNNRARLKNRIKSLLLYYGKDIPENYSMKSWSKRFIDYLETIEFKTEIARECLDIYIEELKESSERIKKLIEKIKRYPKKYGFEGIIDKLCTIPGIGFITAMNIYAEIMDIRRFKRFDQLSSYVGLVPAVHSSGEKERILGLCNRHSKYLRNMLIESAWIAVRKDPALTMKYNELCKRMCKQKAIIRIAKKLLSRIAFVWKNEKKYLTSVIK